MPKRKKRSSEDYLLRKLRRIERKITERHRTRRYSSTCSSSPERPERPERPVPQRPEPERPMPERPLLERPVPERQVPEKPVPERPVVPESPPRSPRNDEEDAENIVMDSHSEQTNVENMMAQDPTEQNKDVFEVPLEDSILKVLGMGHEKPQQWGKKIHKQIAERWESVLINGLDKEEKENILKQPTYLPPENCPHLLVPKLNPETTAACSDITRKRDGYIEARQKMLSASMGGLACAVEKVIQEVEPEGLKLQLLEIVNNTAKILADTFYNENKSRRSLILSGLDKDIKETLTETQPDRFLFGENLYEKIKTAKNVGKTGRDIRLHPKNTLKANLPKHPSNWKGPPRPAPKPQEPRATKPRSSGPRPAAAKKMAPPTKGYRKYSSNHQRSHQH